MGDIVRARYNDSPGILFNLSRQPTSTLQVGLELGSTLLEADMLKLGLSNKVPGPLVV